MQDKTSKTIFYWFSLLVCLVIKLMSHCDTTIIIILILHLNMHFKRLCWGLTRTQDEHLRLVQMINCMVANTR